jgi:hypothetical protein
MSVWMVALCRCDEPKPSCRAWMISGRWPWFSTVRI